MKANYNNGLIVYKLPEKVADVNGWKVYLKGTIYTDERTPEAEYIARGLSHHGINFVSQLNGAFFLIVQNGVDAWVCRDRYGVIPVYTWKEYISDNIQTFIDSGMKPVENEEASRQWMVFNNVLTGETLFEGVNMLEKGTIWHLNSDQKIKYWQWHFSPEAMDYEEARQKLRELVIQAIRRRIPNEDFGAFLSGGVDSNIINLFTGDCFTFTAGFIIGNDERAISSLYGKKHYNVVYNKLRYFDESIRAIETPLVGASWSNIGLNDLVSRFVKICFDGGGADELFGSYLWRYDMEKDYYDVVNRTGVEDCRDIFNEVYPVDSLENRFLFDVNYFLEAVLTVCVKIADVYGLELRCPFIDNDLVDFAVTLPVEYKMNKRILKDAFPELPEVCRGNKKGFSSPDYFIASGSNIQAYNWAFAALYKWREIYG